MFHSVVVFYCRHSYFSNYTIRVKAISIMSLFDVAKTYQYLPYVVDEFPFIRCDTHTHKNEINE